MIETCWTVVLGFGAAPSQAGAEERCSSFPAGAILLTGTGIVPPDAFTLAPGDLVVIRIEGIGELSNTVTTVPA